MKECIIIGRPNSGKTMFALSFASYLGCRNVDITFRTYDNLITCRHLHIEEAKKELCGIAVHKTRTLQSLVLKIQVAKSDISFKLTDSCGLIESIHSDENIRRGMAQTLKLLRYADYIIHIVDLNTVTKEPHLIDTEINNYGLARQNYVMLANKIDLPFAKGNIARLMSMYPKTVILPISALHNLGFKEVKACVARNV